MTRFHEAPRKALLAFAVLVAIALLAPLALPARTGAIELTVSPLGDDALELAWKVKGAAREFVVERRGPFARSWTTVAELGATRFRDGGLASASRYLYRVVALPRGGMVSNEAGATTMAASRQGVAIAPLADTTRVRVSHVAFPGSWTLCIPEYGYNDKDGSQELHSIVWTGAGEGVWSYSWSVDGPTKRATGVDLAGRVAASGDHVDVELTGTNAGTEPWGTDGSKLALFCFRSGDQQAFWDYKAKHTFLHLPAGFVTASQLMKVFAPHRMWSAPVSPGAISRLAARGSADGRWLTAIATDSAAGLSFNFNNEIACIHSNPRWPELKPGESFTAHARVYVLEGTLDELWTAYERDFGPD